jgi:uncharacterized NAD(P)/FAD-binding protein YdhS
MTTTERSDVSARVAVVGAGAAGILTTLRLTHSLRDPGSVVLIDPAGGRRCGPAFSTDEPRHLLNVPASRMSVWSPNDDDFVRWVRRTHDPSAHAMSFVPRRWFGDYLLAGLETARLAASGAPPEIVEGETVAVERAVGGFHLRLADGRSVAAESVVLAVGQGSPRSLGCEHPQVVDDPWRAGASPVLAAVRGSVLLVGTGLTMVDVALVATAHPGTKVVAVSRHGLLPGVHPVQAVTPRAPCLDATVERSARAWLAAVRAAVDDAERSGEDWRGVIDGLRPVSVSLWRALPLVEQRRFLRHLTRYWDVVRHRMAPAVATEIEVLRETGRLQVERGSFVRATPESGRLAVTLRTGGANRTLTVDAVVNCTGPRPVTAPGASELLEQMLAADLVAVHPSGRGIRVSDLGQALDAQGARVAGLWAVGHLRVGHDGEAVAIPEIRLHADDVAHGLSPTTWVAG